MVDALIKSHGTIGDRLDESAVALFQATMASL
jgi:hypothetical protein